MQNTRTQTVNRLRRALKRNIRRGLAFRFSVICMIEFIKISCEPRTRTRTVKNCHNISFYFNMQECVVVVYLY